MREVFDALFLILVVPVTFVIGMHIVAWLLRRRASRLAAWENAAKARGGGFGDGAIEAKVEHAIVVVRVRPHGTEAQAVYALGAGPRFDSSYASYEGVWTPRAQRLLDAIDQRAKITSDGRRVTLAVPKIVREQDELEVMLDLVGELASYGARDLAALADLPDAVFKDTTGSWDSPSKPRLRIEREEQHRIEIGCLPSGGRPELTLTVDFGRSELEPFSIDVRKGELIGTVPRGLFGEAARAELPRLGDATVTGTEDRMRITLAEGAPRSAVEAAIDVLAELARRSPRGGAFR